MTKPLIANFQDVHCPCYAFLVAHSSGRKLLFDLGIRKDWENSPASIVHRIKKNSWKVDVEKNVIEILSDHGQDPAEIEAVIWSHYHWDHTGDPSTFPSSTALVVGPGVARRFPIGWPTNDKANVHETAWAGRERREISFDDGSLKIGRFKAFDYFGDGSFYLLDTPGHLLGHMCGLARTTSNSFIMMGGDAAHHAGEFRPTEYMPLPRNIDIESAPRGFPCPCPADLLVEHVHPERSATKPFYQAADGFNEESEVADWTIDGIGELDANPRVFSVIAHDASLLQVVKFFPESANDWEKQGWQTTGRWRFVADFAQGLPDASKL